MPVEEDGLDAAWRRWVVEALRGGAAPADVVRGLVAEGVAEPLAVREVGVLVDGLGPLLRGLRRGDLLARVQAELGAGDVVEGAPCDADEFHARYFTVFRPARFAGGCAALAAPWSFAALRRRFADAELEVSGRRTTVAAAIDAMLAPGAPPGLYLVSKDRALDGALRALRDELAPLPPFLDAERARATANLWMGPGGTTSVLHHDTTCVWFCQLVGRKRYRLVAPWQRAALDAEITDGWDSALDLDGGVAVREASLDAGDALYIPTGWWHEVVAETPSISVSFRAFRWPTEHGWYAPGHLR
jgi:hypothetical protein